jgi:hypothetical protein
MENQEQQEQELEDSLNNVEKLERSYKRKGFENFTKNLIDSGADFLIRNGSECRELIYDTIHNVYATQNNNFPKNKVFLFNLVNRDVKKYLEKNGSVILKPKKNTAEWNWNYDNEVGTITGTDLDHAYWRIAYVNNYISKKTYEYGLDDKCKALRLATISVLGREKKYLQYKNGVYVGEVIRQQKNKELHNVFMNVRYSCYFMMFELSQLLGDDFFCWKTDCIYYRDTIQNRKLVHKYLEEREILYKQLIFNSLDKFEEIK